MDKVNILVEELNAAKEQYILLEAMRQNPNPASAYDREPIYPVLNNTAIQKISVLQNKMATWFEAYFDSNHGKTEEDVLKDVLSMLSSIADAKIPVGIGEELTAELSDRIIDMCDESDGKFYHDVIPRGNAYYAEFWNEVQNPSFIEEFFSAYIDRFKTAEDAIFDTDVERVHDGCAMLTYYDIADIGIIFESESAARAFAERNPVDPSDILLFAAGGWGG